ncbi:Aldo-ket-red domain-containing protein [Mycena indigotica]|uniref:Aldo-ket-red domain-containing protein n=1 Tax=Mycena indigotica TaxID=2126181 RepID=A0A8H6S7H4_9AGAR|nr:Aldo-ket-red domain-containing protein [Mycena indigotica]KAF7293723.1 Aldo-ket-red domain-containing protein [Mycena indigotica]
MSGVEMHQRNWTSDCRSASRSRDGLRRSIWRGLSNPSLFAGESDTQGGGLYWAETSGVKSAADGPDGKQQGTTGGASFSRSTAPTDGAPPSADTTGPFADAAIDSHSTPLHLPPCPLQSPSSTQKRCPSAGWAPAVCACRSSLSAAGSPSEAPSSGESVKDIMQAAFENGINMFDTAEDYQKGAAEREMGHAIKELGWRRTDLVISTKIFWSHEPGTGPNHTGLSHKHVIEGTKACLRRLQMDYVDVIFASLRYHRLVPMEEIVRAFNYVIDQGWVSGFLLGHLRVERTRSRRRIVSVYLSRDLPSLTRSTDVATRLNLIAPIAEQCKHNMFHRERPEKEYAPLYAKYGLGTTAFSALQGGLLTGKYNDGIPDGTRFATVPMFRGATEGPQGEELLWKVRLLSQIAAGASFLPDLLNSGRNRAGARLEANLGALEVLPKLDAAVLARIEAVLGNRPQEPETYGRPPLDQGIL